MRPVIQLPGGVGSISTRLCADLGAVKSWPGNTAAALPGSVQRRPRRSFAGGTPPSVPDLVETFSCDRRRWPGPLRPGRTAARAVHEAKRRVALTGRVWPHLPPEGRVREGKVTGPGFAEACRLKFAFRAVRGKLLIAQWWSPGSCSFSCEGGFLWDPPWRPSLTHHGLCLPSHQKRDSWVRILRHCLRLSLNCSSRRE